MANGTADFTAENAKNTARKTATEIARHMTKPGREGIRRTQFNHRAAKAHREEADRDLSAGAKATMLQPQPKQTEI